MTDFEPYVDEPRELAPTEPRARLRAAVAWTAALVLLAALLSLWLRGQGQEDPALRVPEEHLTAPATEPPTP